MYPQLVVRSYVLHCATSQLAVAFVEKEENLGIFEGRNVHFESCSTLKMSEKDIKIFKQLTKARTNYKRVG